MERKKNDPSELTAGERRILGGLIFTEPFSRILEVAGGHANLVGADLKHLIVKRFVQVMEADDKGDFRPTFYYDSDNLHAFYYRATERGHAAYGSSDGK
jgi:hypothetical protein